MGILLPCDKRWRACPALRLLQCLPSFLLLLLLQAPRGRPLYRLAGWVRTVGWLQRLVCSNSGRELEWLQQMASSWAAGWLRLFTESCWFQRCSGCRSHEGVADQLTLTNSSNRNSSNSITNRNRNRKCLKEGRRVETRLGSPNHRQEEDHPVLRWRSRWQQR